jgi:hypothetical protein
VPFGLVEQAQQAVAGCCRLMQAVSLPQQPQHINSSYSRNTKHLTSRLTTYPSASGYSNASRQLTHEVGNVNRALLQ